MDAKPNTTGKVVARTDLSHAIRASLNAKLARLVSRPIIARISREVAELIPNDTGGDGEDAVAATASADDVSWVVKVEFDYDGVWRDREKELADAFDGAVESHVALLSDQERALLERSPEDFLALEQRPATAQLLKVRRRRVGRATHVVDVMLATEAGAHRGARHVAILPNLVQLERQLDALAVIEAAEDAGPLGALRALVGIGEAAVSSAPAAPLLSRLPDEKLDDHQMRCVSNALATPHFAVIEGPPGSGKTTVISAIVRRSLERGERVLIVSPTNVAVNNVVERLCTLPEDDRLEPRSLPIRYSGSATKTGAAVEYWVGPNKQQRARTIQHRVRQRLCTQVPFAAELYAKSADDGAGPLSAALSDVASVICGTPLGILSYSRLKNSAAATFDLLVVDEVSKLTLPEFLAIAVKARRWVLVGDPQQLPPHNGAEENASALDDLIPPGIEVACSAVALAAFERRAPRLVVVASDPVATATLIRARFDEVAARPIPTVTTLTDGGRASIVVCRPDQLEAARAMIAPSQKHMEEDILLVIERGLPWQSPPPARSGFRVAPERTRTQSLIFSTCYDAYHALPWSIRSGRTLRNLSGSATARVMPSSTMLPTAGAIDSNHPTPFTLMIAERVAVNMVSVYDWVTGLPAGFEHSPLREMHALDRVGLASAVSPFVGTLKRQYRMAPALSAVPRALFYFGAALHDAEDKGGGVIHLVRIKCGAPPDDSAEGTAVDDAEANASEVDEVRRLLEKLNGYSRTSEQERPTLMIITPYSAQKDALDEMRADMERTHHVDGLALEVCTLDSCQGREADVVIISLVKGRTTTFLDNPKRWNVALTRAKRALYVVGDIEVFLDEARGRTRHPTGADGYRGPTTRPVSVVARVIDAYQRQLATNNPKVQR